MRRLSPPMVAFICHADTKPSDSILEVTLFESHCSIITPEVVEALIREARRTGWDPASKGAFVIGPNQSFEHLSGNLV